MASVVFQFEEDLAKSEDCPAVFTHVFHQICTGRLSQTTIGMGSAPPHETILVHSSLQRLCDDLAEADHITYFESTRIAVWILQRNDTH